MRILKDFNVGNYTVTIKEDRKKKRLCYFTNLSGWGSPRYSIQTTSTENIIKLESNDVGFKLPVIPLAHGLYEIGVGETIWKELNKYYGSKES